MRVLTGHPELDVLLHPERLHEALGRDDLHVTRIRHKPGQYAVAALADPEGPLRWLRVTGRRDRTHRDAERAERLGRSVTLATLPGDLYASSGDLWTDPKLAGRLDRLADLVDAAVVVRHNPLRRLVLRRGSTQVRVTADPQPEVESWAGALLDPAAGLTATLRGRVGKHLTRWEWVDGQTVDAALGHGDGDDHEAGEGLGRLLARVHATPADPHAADAAPRALTVDHDALRQAGEDLAALDPDLGARMLDLVAALPAAPVREARVLHGDFSADQVVASSSGLRLIDLDRAALGAPARDIASCLAFDALRTGTLAGPVADGLRTGYTDGGGRWPSADELASATAAALLGRAQEPLRQARPDWRQGTREILEIAAEELS